MLGADTRDQKERAHKIKCYMSAIDAAKKVITGFHAEICAIDKAWIEENPRLFSIRIWGFSSRVEQEWAIIREAELSIQAEELKC